MASTVTRNIFLLWNLKWEWWTSYQSLNESLALCLTKNLRYFQIGMFCALSRNYLKKCGSYSKLSKELKKGTNILARPNSSWVIDPNTIFTVLKLLGPFRFQCHYWVAWIIYYKIHIPWPYFWRFCVFSQKIKQLWTKYPIDLIRNVPRNSKKS